MDRQYTLCVLVPAHQYRTYVDNYHQHAHHHRLQQQRQFYPQRQQSNEPPYQQEQIYENVVSQYRMRMCYHNDYENDEQIQRFYWEQCYRRDDNTDATAYYYCEYVRAHENSSLFYAIPVVHAFLRWCELRRRSSARSSAFDTMFW